MKKIIPKFYGKIVRGDFQLNPQDKDYYAKYMRQFKEDQEIEITLKKRFRKRTQGGPGEETNFNGYYWGVVIAIIADYQGEIDTSAVSDDVLLEVGHFRVNRYGKKVPKSTSDLSGQEFSDLCAKIRIWASKEHELFIPLPHEAEYEA